VIDGTSKVVVQVNDRLLDVAQKIETWWLDCSSWSIPLWNSCASGCVTWHGVSLWNLWECRITYMSRTTR
jgi:hypothetical protein